MENVLINALEQGLIYAFMAMGVLLTFIMLGFPDLTVEGTFPLGAAVTATAVVSGISPVYAVILGSLAGGLAGAATGLMHTKLKINNILAGIITTSAIYTIMLRLMGRPNTPLLSYDNVYGQVLGWIGISQSQLTAIQNHIAIILILSVAVLVLRLIMGWFLATDLGLAIRATGNNERMIRNLGVNTDNTKLIALVISNCLVAFSGALACQVQGFADVGMGIGVLVASIASVIIGESLFGKRSVGWLLTGVILGSIFYRGVLALALHLGFPAHDFKLITAVLVLAALSIPLLKYKKRKNGVFNGSTVLRWHQAILSLFENKAGGRDVTR
ncbi:ABC transporter permease [Desulfofundulus salinus]|uniref:ABC transporter permease n=1 Tax=Desulfofundulus salinus TaxID=2419843 RepID=A0A494X5X5_9FIRM|nr:ABC transporter permease [Desulfofundulus salinum]RKO68174.1 ABC transporter permease [Desulfofundulus salinum]